MLPIYLVTMETVLFSFKDRSGNPNFKVLEAQNNARTETENDVSHCWCISLLGQVNNEHTLEGDFETQL